MKNVMVLVFSGLMGIAGCAFGQTRPVDEAARAQRLDRAQQARVQQDRAKQARLDQPDLRQQRLEQARLKQERLEQARLKNDRITDARAKDERIKNARQKKQRIKHARIKAAREDEANGGDDQLNRRRYHKAKKEAKRKRLANQTSGEETDN